MQITGRSILITGAGSGIGRAVAIALARKGARLTLLGRTLSKLAETASSLPVEAVGDLVEGDVGDGETRLRAIAAAEARFGALHVLINNAGAVRAGRLERTEEDEIRAMIEVNLTAPILFARDALPALRRTGEGAVVNVSSGLGLVGGPFYSTYAGAKAGIARFGEALRRELLDEGVHVLTVYPGATETPMMASNHAGPDLGFTREPAEAVADALVAGLEGDALEVIRGGETRLAMIAANRDRPPEVDARFRSLKPKLEEAVRDHAAL